MPIQTELQLSIILFALPTAALRMQNIFMFIVSRTQRKQSGGRSRASNVSARWRVASARLDYR